eukprot:gene29137-35166_t
MDTSDVPTVAVNGKAKLEVPDSDEERHGDITKPHPQELCGKCQRIGYYCREQYRDYY